MKNLRMLSVLFSEEIRFEELENFRGALVEKVGMEHERYHNHNNSGNGAPQFHYRYPLIQYRLVRRRPRLIFLEDAVGDARHFFTQQDWDLHMNGRDYRTKIEELKATQHEVGVTPGKFQHYRLHRWQPFNTDNYQRFQQLETLKEKVEFLEGILAGQLLSFFSGIDYKLPQRFRVDLTRWDRTDAGHYKGIQVLLFDVSFRAELVLPPHVGFGKGVSIGYGGVWKVREEEQGNPGEELR